MSRVNTTHLRVIQAPFFSDASKIQIARGIENKCRVDAIVEHQARDIGVQEEFDANASGEPLSQRDKTWFA